MSLSTLVLSLADNKQMLGLRYAEWATRAPSLEADIAAAAMGLDDLGHSRVLYGCLEPLGEDPRSADRDSNPAGYLNAAFFDRPLASWAEFVAANAVLDSSFTVVIQACVEGNVEERFHFLHARSWLRAGIDTEPLIEAWRQAIEFFGPDDGELAQLHREGKLSLGPPELRARLDERLEQPAPVAVTDWSGWDPIRRRSRPGAIDSTTFAMLRGLEDRRFMPAGAGSKEEQTT
jgi:1,2-phenylacetyl-CoA epoxidase catalytic subunit